MLEWTIVGGGPHGCIIANALLHHAGVKPEALRIVDPHAKPLADWTRRARACGMQYLRSPGAHSLAPDFGSLFAHARRKGFGDDHFIVPYQRPSLELFGDHASEVTAHLGITPIWRRGTVRTIVPADGGYRVGLEDGTSLKTRRVVLAAGGTAEPARPSWATGIPHIFDPEFDRSRVEQADRPVIVGGGISAVQLSLHLTRQAERHHPVRVISLEPLAVSQFDSDPCYIGPSCMRRFLSESIPPGRNEILAEARRPGTIPPDLADAFAAEIRRGTIEHSVERLTAVNHTGNPAADAVVLATGFAPGPPIPALLEQISADCAESGELPRDPNGFPLPAPDLSWAPGIFLSGRLAQIELGPSAGNLIGGHNGAKRIVSALHGKVRLIPQAWWRYAPASVSSSSA